MKPECKFFILLVFLLFTVEPICARPAQEKQPRFTILGLGDSITEGGDYFSSYIFPLWEKLFAGGYLVDFTGPKTQKCRIGELNHAGYSGMTVEYLDTHIDTIYAKHPADIVLLHAGHNHFVEEKPVAGMIAAYKSIIKKLKTINPQAKILVAQVIQSGKLPKYSYIPELNGEIARMVKELNDPQVYLVDQAAHFNWQEHTVEDKVHPNKAGAEQMAQTWYEALTKILPEPPVSFHPEKIAYKAVEGHDSLTMHLFKPAGWKPEDKRPAIVYFFAGGWTHGSPLQFYRECAWYASRGMVAVSVDYRIASLHQSIPGESLEDAREAVRRIRLQADEWGIDSKRIAVSGASAGGYLAGEMGSSAPGKSACYYPNLLILNYPVVDRIKEVNEHVPPILFLVGSQDPVVSLSSVDVFKKKVEKQQGSFELHVFEGAGHPIFLYRKDPDESFYKIRDLTDNFLRRHGYLE